MNNFTISNVNQVESKFIDLYGEISDFQRERYSTLIKKFYKEFGKYGYIASSSGRVELIGNHTDHNGGKCVACSISLDTLAVFLPTDNNEILIKSLEYPDVQVKINSKEIYKKGTSDSLVKGIVDGFINRGFNVWGFIALTTSNVSGGCGVSSSASFELLICEILNFLYNDGKVSKKDKAIISKLSENEYFGKPCGLLDQSAISFGGIVNLDFSKENDVFVERINNQLNEFSLVLVETGGDHKDLTEDYALIPLEMKKIASYFGKERLIDVEYDKFLSKIDFLKEKYPIRAVNRAIHFFEENKRVELLTKSLQNNDYKCFIKCIKESGESSLNLLENCVANNDNEHLIPKALDYCLKFLGEGANRVHGGGFAGTILNVIRKDNLSYFIENTEKVYGKGKVIPLNVRNVGSVVL